MVEGFTVQQQAEARASAETYLGTHHYAHPDPALIDPRDIAHALSNLCRYAGHVDRFYSVAEHCVLVSLWLEDVGCDEATQLEGLLHDATEAYVVDVPRPLKVSLPEYRAVEARVAIAVAERFGLPISRMSDGVAAFAIESQIVKEADSRILLDERAALMAGTRHPWDVDSLEPLGVEVIGWMPPSAEARYLRRFHELTRAIEGTPE